MIQKRRKGIKDGDLLQNAEIDHIITFWHLFSPVCSMAWSTNILNLIFSGKFKHSNLEFVWSLEIGVWNLCG